MFCPPALFGGTHGEMGLVSAGSMVVKACRAGLGHSWGCHLAWESSLGYEMARVLTPILVSWRLRLLFGPSQHNPSLPSRVPDSSPLQDGEDPTQGMQWGHAINASGQILVIPVAGAHEAWQSLTPTFIWAHIVSVLLNS